MSLIPQFNNHTPKITHVEASARLTDFRSSLREYLNMEWKQPDSPSSLLLRALWSLVSAEMTDYY